MKFPSSHEFIVVRSIGMGLARAASTCGHVLPLNVFVSTLDRTNGTSNTRTAFASATLLLMTVWRSKFATPKSICGCRSIIATTQLSGVSRPFSLRLTFGISFLLAEWEDARFILVNAFANDGRSHGHRS